MSSGFPGIYLRRALALWPTLALAACTLDAPPPGESQPASGLASSSIPVRRVDPPSSANALAPNLTVAGDGVLLTWLQPTESGHRLLLAKLSQESWSAPRQIAAGDRFFANWADLPLVTETVDGLYFSHWLESLGEDPYAYGVKLARSEDGGATWEALGLLHDDKSESEHGFVSYVRLPEDGVQAFWLDGRAMSTGGSMQLRTTRLDLDGPERSTVLDDRVCECCATDAALAGDGSVVVYRDRSQSEVRDIAVVRATADGWSEPRRLHDDGWQIHGCPVNGPAIAADGQRVAVAWFTAAKGQAEVQVAVSTDGGATFAEPVLVDGERPLGRVDVVMANDGGAVVSWLGSAADDAEIRWRHVSSKGELGSTRVMSTTMPDRSSGVPRMVRKGGELLFVWVEGGEPFRLRASLVPMPTNVS